MREHHSPLDAEASLRRVEKKETAEGGSKKQERDEAERGARSLVSRCVCGTSIVNEQRQEQREGYSRY